MLQPSQSVGRHVPGGCAQELTRTTVSLAQMAIIKTSNSTIDHMHNDQSEVRVATFYRPHGIYDTEANMNDLETDGYYVVWGWKVFFEF